MDTDEYCIRQVTSHTMQIMMLMNILCVLLIFTTEYIQKDINLQRVSNLKVYDNVRNNKCEEKSDQCNWLRKFVKRIKKYVNKLRNKYRNVKGSKKSLSQESRIIDIVKDEVTAEDVRDDTSDSPNIPREDTPDPPNITSKVIPEPPTIVIYFTPA